MKKKKSPADAGLFIFLHASHRGGASFTMLPGRRFPCLRPGRERQSENIDFLIVQNFRHGKRKCRRISAHIHEQRIKSAGRGCAGGSFYDNGGEQEQARRACDAGQDAMYIQQKELMTDDAGAAGGTDMVRGEDEDGLGTEEGHPVHTASDRKRNGQLITGRFLVGPQNLRTASRLRAGASPGRGKRILRTPIRRA